MSETDYLCIEPFLRNFVDVQALATALRNGVVDRLRAVETMSFAALRHAIGGDARGLRLLLDLLQAAGVVHEGWRLTEPFREALRFRDLLEAKIEFANIAGPDLIAHFASFVQAPGEFMARAEMFRLFAYGRCFERSEEAYRLTRRWMRLTTALTRYEAPVCAAHHDFRPHRQMLDVGGNSGEFVLQICRRNPALKAAVFDLPVVCDLGREHVAPEPEAARIAFHPGDALAAALPRGFDLVTFKSVLHDWPDAEAQQFLARAAEALERGGRVLIFERCKPDLAVVSLSYGMLPLAIFAHCYREPECYVEWLAEAGFGEITVERVELELPFMLISAAKE